MSNQMLLYKINSNLLLASSLGYKEADKPAGLETIQAENEMANKEKQLTPRGEDHYHNADKKGRLNNDSWIRIPMICLLVRWSELDLRCSVAQRLL